MLIRSFKPVTHMLNDWRGGQMWNLGATATIRLRAEANINRDFVVTLASAPVAEARLRGRTRRRTTRRASPLQIFARNCYTSRGRRLGHMVGGRRWRSVNTERMSRDLKRADGSHRMTAVCSCITRPSNRMTHFVN
jgi:hypothetical protein